MDANNKPYIVVNGKKLYENYKAKTVIDETKITTEERGGLTYTYLDGKPICGAKTRRTGAICLKSPIKGKNRCMLHGGKSLSGLASPRRTTGKYSKDLPARLADKYEESIKDPKILELKDEIAVMNARISDLLSRIDESGSKEKWKEVRGLYKKAKDAIKSRQQDEFAKVFAEIGRIIEQAEQDFKNWDEVSKAMRMKKSLAESQRRHQIEQQQMISSEEAMALIGFIVATIKETITDRAALASITQKIGGYLNSNNTIKVGRE